MAKRRSCCRWKRFRFLAVDNSRRTDVEDRTRLDASGMRRAKVICRCGHAAGKRGIQLKWKRRPPCALYSKLHRRVILGRSADTSVFFSPHISSDGEGGGKGVDEVQRPPFFLRTNKCSTFCGPTSENGRLQAGQERGRRGW